MFRVLFLLIARIISIRSDHIGSITKRNANKKNMKKNPVGICAVFVKAIIENRIS
jgi:hypothetical protein